MSERLIVENQGGEAVESMRAFSPDTEPTFEMVAGPRFEKWRRGRAAKRLRKDARADKEYMVMVGRNGGVDPYAKKVWEPGEKAYLFQLGTIFFVGVAGSMAMGPFWPLGILLTSGIGAWNMKRSAKKFA